MDNETVKKHEPSTNPNRQVPPDQQDNPQKQNADQKNRPDTKQDFPLEQKPKEMPISPKEM